MFRDEQFELFDQLHPEYLDGFNTGIEWKDKYIPGGPWVYDNESRFAYEAWHRGFKSSIFRTKNPLMSKYK